MTALSHLVVFCCLCAWHAVATGLMLQFLCCSCAKWKDVQHKHGAQCNDCHHHWRALQQPLPEHERSLSPSPPPPTLFNRPPGCIDQLTLVQRAAIITLDKIGYLKSR